MEEFIKRRMPFYINKIEDSYEIFVRIVLPKIKTLPPLNLQLPINWNANLTAGPWEREACPPFCVTNATDTKL